MAVPKKKRYKQIVNVRRTLFNIILLRKKNLNITKFGNFKTLNYNINSNDLFFKSCSCCFRDCGSCLGSSSNKVCNFCSNFNYF